VVVIVEDAHCGTPAIVAISLTIWTVINGTLTGAATTFVPTGPMCAGIDQLSGGDYMCRFRDLTQSCAKWPHDRVFHRPVLWKPDQIPADQHYLRH